MFDTLLESLSRRTNRPSRWGAAVALALHLLVVAAFLRRPQLVQASRPIIVEPLTSPTDPRSRETVEDGFRVPGTLRIVHSDHPAFEAPAIESLRGARFRPARVMGRAVRVLVQIPVAFVQQR